MLDDLKYIHERDAQDALGIAEKQWQQLEHEFELSAELKPDHVYNVVVGGMGGSALAAQMAKVWPGFGEPYEVVRDYKLPEYVDGDTLFIASSYSGNTEETLSTLAEAEYKGATIAIITHGGKLLEIAREKNYPCALMPEVSGPRYAVLYNLKALLTITDACGVTKNKAAELGQTSSWLKTQIQNWSPAVATTQNQAKQIAQDLVSKSIVVYGGPELYPAAYKWKINFNENAKHIAWCDQLPEFNHNEMLGWTKQPVDKPYAVVDLRSKLEHPRIQKRFEVTARLLSGLRPEPIVVEAQGETILEQLLWTITLGDFTSLYLALLNNLNPTPVELIEKFKKALDE